MIMFGEKSKSTDVEDDYTCPACGVPRLAWQTECSECGRKFDEDIEIKSDDELETTKRKAKEVEKLAKKKKGHWRNLDPKEYSKIKNSLYAVEIVLMLLLVINTIYMKLEMDPFYLPIGPSLFIILVFAIIFTVEGLWFKYIDIIRARSYDKRVGLIKELRMRSQSVLVVCIILIIILFSLGFLEFFGDMLKTENDVYLPGSQTEKFSFYSQDPLGLTEVTNVDVKMNRSIEIYLMADTDNGDIAPDRHNSINFTINNTKLDYELDAPGFELDFITREGYILYGYNGGSNATAEGVYTIHRELSKPLLFTLTLFIFIFIILSGCWIAYLHSSKKFYDRLHEEKIEELTARYKVDPFTIEDVFLVYCDGTLITHQTRRLKALDDDIFMGMLTSIKDFIKDAMSQDTKGELNELSYGKLRILIEHGAYLFLAVVVSGRPPSELRKLMTGAVKRIHQTHLDLLRNWDGNIGKMDPAKKIITEMLIKESKGTGKIQKFDKRSATAWNDKGVVLTKIGKYKEAISCFDRAIKIKPNVSDVWSNKGIVLFKLHKYERAMRAFDKALQLNPYNKKATHRREKCWYKMQLKASKIGQRVSTGGLQDRPGYASQRQATQSYARSNTPAGRAATSMDYGSAPVSTGAAASGAAGTPATVNAGGREFKGRASGFEDSATKGTEPCPDCSQPMRYSDENKDWWCDNCNRYPYDEEDEYDQPSEEEYPCETCGQSLEFIDEYQKWYCDHCQKYA